MNESNIHWLKITGKVNIPVPLDIDTDYGFAGNISVYGMTQGSKQDGSFNYTFSAKFVDEIHLIKGEQIIKAVDKEHKSQTLRKAIFALGFSYEEFMNHIMRNLDELALSYEANQINEV